MRRLLDLRIVRWELKLAYIVGVLLLGFLIAWLLRSVGVPEVAITLVLVGVDLVALLLGARIFRGRGEAIEPSRPPWRMTARPRLSRVLGIIFIVLSAETAVRLLLDALGADADRPLTVEMLVIGAIGVIEFAVFGALYLRSAARLQRLGVPPKEPKAPKFKPTVRIRP
ncbi:hypothetical protein ACWEOH_02740 [Agromyces sp. NPDC004153]